MKRRNSPACSVGRLAPMHLAFVRQYPLNGSIADSLTYLEMVLKSLFLSFLTPETA